MTDKPGQMGIFFYTSRDEVHRYFSIIPKTQSAICEVTTPVNTHNLMLQICSEILHTVQNLTADCGFTSIETAEVLYEKAYQLPPNV